jgi:hypothetical protein
VRPLGRTKRCSRGEAESGQAAIEAAIILPLFVFLILGTLQLGLMHQARLMTKYAAFRAVRAGSLHNARKDDMERAALAAVLPLVSEGRDGGEYIQPITRAEDFQKKWGRQGVSGNKMPDTQLPYVEVTLCGPTRREISGGLRELDFDDPRFAASDGWRASHRTKLRIQLTLNYRMPIPFANWVIHSIALQREIPWLMRMGQPERRPHGFDSKYEEAAAQGVYILPIRAAYTLRMQSNLYTSGLPEANACLTTNRY